MNLVVLLLVLFCNSVCCMEMARVIPEPGSSEYEKARAALLADNRRALLTLSGRFEDAKLNVEKMVCGTVVKKGSSYVFPQKQSVQNVALNSDGSRVAIACGSECRWGKVAESKREMQGVSFCAPLQGLAFDKNKVRLSNAINSYLEKESEVGFESVYDTDFKPRAFVSTLSHNGKWGLNERIRNNQRCLELWKLDLPLSGHDMGEVVRKINQVHSLAVDDAGSCHVLASTAKIAFVDRIPQDNKSCTFNTIILNEDVRPAYIAAVDITRDGKHVLAAGDRALYIYTFNSSSHSKDVNVRSRLEHKYHIFAARFSPCGSLILMGTSKGIVIYDWKNGNENFLGMPENVSLPFSCVAWSQDSKTIAAGNDQSSFVVSCRSLESKLTNEQLALLKKLWAPNLTKEQVNAVFEDRTCVNVFKSIAKESVKKQLIKILSIDWQKIEYRECPICMDAFTDTTTVCNHSFCKRCLNEWLEIKKSCPICRRNLL